MAKYTEAFCVTTGSMISIMQMRSEYNHDPAIYEKVYKGHLFCPGCQAVPLTVVHTNGQLYYRGHPHEEHADGCWYALDERVVKSVTEINGDSEEQALSQLDLLLRATFNGNQQAANARAANRNANRSNAPVVHQQQEARRRLPQCRIEDLPVRLATNDRPQEISIYYGKVLCEIPQQDRHQSISNKRCCDKKNYHGADNILGCMGTSYDRSASITAIDPATYSHCVPRWAFGVANSRDEASSYVLP